MKGHEHEYEPIKNLVDSHVGRLCLWRSMDKKNSLFVNQASSCAYVD
jgi:hypothetical protein